MLEHTEQAKKFYKTTQWKKTRNAYMDMMNGLCERCGDAGYIVHHIEHINSRNINDASVTLNFDNLEVLCLPCHNQEHFRTHESTREDVTFDEYGQLVQIKSRK